MNPTSPSRPAGDEKRVVFLYELLRGTNASLAAVRAGLSRGTAYRWKLEDPEFATLWTEIVASRPRRRDLRRRVLERAQRGAQGRVPGRKARFESSQLASHGTLADPSPEAAWDKDLGPAFKVRW